MEIWESVYQNNKKMWGPQAAEVTTSIMELFKELGLNKILIPGYGYGRNAQVFIQNGFDVTGIEISQTAINIAKEKLGESIKIYHGSVSSMPFDQDLYDSIYCYSLIHLLNEEDRLKLIRDCYHQLQPGGYMVFIAISKLDTRFGQGKEISKDTFDNKKGVNLFFYDSDSIEKEFGNYGYLEFKEINEPQHQPTERFCQIICKK